MDKRQPGQIHPLVIDIGSSVVYIAICISLILYCYKHPVVVQEESQNWAKVLIDSVFSSAAIALDAVEIIIAALLLWQKKEISKRSIALFSIATFIFVNFNAYALHYPLDIYVIVLIDGIIYVLCAMYSFFWGSGATITYYSNSEKALGKITHKAIIAEQLFSYRRTEKNGFVIYTITADEYVARSEQDINGILTVTYRLPLEDDMTIAFIRKTYSSFVNEGNEETRMKLIDTLGKETERLTNKLKSIPSVNDVSSNDCCLARVLMIYLAFLRILDPPPDNPQSPLGKRDNGWYGSESYIGELGLDEGEIGIDVDIEKKLFTLLRTGLLGALLVGSDSHYVFNYMMSGSKNDRRYSATELCDADGKQINKICLFALAGINTSAIPPYVFKGIKNEEIRITKRLYEIRKK